MDLWSFAALIISMTLTSSSEPPEKRESRAMSVARKVMFPESSFGVP
jgi:hypothetical protein